jgi:RNA polymerase sigma-70 factor (ECF subfamily)
MPNEDLSQRSTRELIERAKRSDHASWRELLRRFGPTLTVAVHGRIPTSLRGRFDTNDVVQSAVVNLLGSLRNFEYEDDEKFKSWLRGLARSKLLDRIRSHSRHCRTPSRESRDGGTEGFASDGDRTPSEIVGDAELHALTLEELTQLDPLDRDLVWLRLFEEREWRDVAETLGLTRDAAKKRYARILSKVVRGLK